jgi:hypothetical protein
VKKVPQARYSKRSKKAKEANISLEAHAPTVSPDDVSNFSLLAFHSCISTLTHFFFQALVKRFIALGTECAGYLKVAKASEGITFAVQSPLVFCTLSFVIYLTHCRLLMQLF